MSEISSVRRRQHVNDQKNWVSCALRFEPIRNRPPLTLNKPRQFGLEVVRARAAVAFGRSNPSLRVESELGASRAEAERLIAHDARIRQELAVDP